MKQREFHLVSWCSGGWPRMARAQQPALPEIGYLITSRQAQRELRDGTPQRIERNRLRRGR